MILSILTPVARHHMDMYQELKKEFEKQTRDFGLIIGTDIDWSYAYSGGLSTGELRNSLLRDAKGEYVCFFDADDWPAEDYIKTIFQNLSTNPDCLSLMGVMTTDGENPEVFEHSLYYKEWKTNESVKYGGVKYERYPNHLNVIKSEIAKQFQFPDKTFGEDHDWSTQLHKSGLLKKEVVIKRILYYYRYVTKK